ncbi:MAG: fibronectin type III domain-containing protein [Bacteroidota bacterium]
MENFTKSISNIIILCLLLAGNQAFSTNSNIFEEPKATTILAPPPAPVLSAAIRTMAGISFTTPVVASTTYLVRKKVNNGAYSGTMIVPVPAGMINTFTDAFVPVAGTSYTYEVIAVVASEQSTPVEVTSCDVTKPIITTPPVANTTMPPLGITLNITAGSILAGSTYSVYRSTTSGVFAAPPIATGQTNLVSYFDGFTPLPATTYYYKLIATNATSCTNESDQKSVVIGALPTAVITSVTKASPFVLNVNWQSIGSPTPNRWHILRSENGGAYIEIHNTPPSDLTYPDGLNNGKLKPNTQYCYKVFATFELGNGPASAPVCNTTDPLPVPTNLTATANNCSRITLNWVEPSAAVLNEENFVIYRAENGGALTEYATIGNNRSSYIDDNLKPNTTYAYKILSVYSGVKSNLTDLASATTAPSILTLVSNSATTANILWNKCTPFAQGWKVFVSTNDGPYVEKAQTGPQEDHYNFTGLLPQTKYTMYVINFFGSGPGGATNTISFTTPKFPGPTNLNAFPNGTTSIKVTWQDNSNGPDHEEGFVLYRSTDNGVNYTQINLPPLITEYIDNDNLKASQKICYYVVARHATGFSEASNTKCEVTCPNLLTEFTKISAASTTEIDLEWAQPENFGPSTITIESSLDGVTFSKLADIPGTSTSYKDITALPNQKKYYRANVKNEGSCSSIYSLIASTTSCPLAPTNVVAKSLSSNSVEVKWDLGENMVKYIIERSTDNIDFVKAGEVVGTLSVFEDKPLASSKKYYYRVSAVNEGCTSAPSQVKQESTAVTCPTPPSNLVAVANSASEIKITFTDNSPDELGFEVEWSKDEKTWTKVGGNVTANSTTATFSTGVDAETKYFFRVRALAEICNSDFSNIANVTTNPPAPTGLSAKGVKITQIDLAWTNTSKTANGIEIQRASGADNNFVKIGDAAIALTSYQNTALTPATSYKYRIRYTSPNGTSDWSNIAEATTLVISANEDSELSKQIELYPVPTENTLYIKPSGTILGKVSTRIVSLSGASLITQEFNGLSESKIEQINVSRLGTGIYFLQISTKNGSATKKFMKQ